MTEVTTPPPSQLKIELWSAFLEAKKEFQEIVKNKKGNHSHYSDLGEIISKTEPVLLKHGLLFIQNPITVDGRTGMESMLVHCATGQIHIWDWVPDKSLLAVSQKGIQAAGSLVTYLRRYHQEAIFNLKAQDDDGQASLPENKPMGQKQVDYLSDPQIRRLYALIKQARTTPDSVIPTIKEKSGIEHINQLSKADYEKWCKYLEGKATAAEQEEKQQGKLMQLQEKKQQLQEQPL